jgi:hypothetical protein
MSMRVDKYDVRRFIKRTEPGGHVPMIAIDPVYDVEFAHCNIWAKSRSIYSAYDLEGADVALAPFEEGEVRPLPQGTVIVRVDMFENYPIACLIFCHPADLGKVLPDHI